MDVEVLASELRVPEGPVSSGDGSVYFVEAAGTALSVWKDGTVSVVADCGGGTNGAAFGPDGRIYVANNGGHQWATHDTGILVPLPHDLTADEPPGSIQAVDVATGEVETLYTSVEGRPISALNDIVFDEAGGFYVADTGRSYPDHVQRGRLYYGKPDGSGIVTIATGLDRPNGVGISPDGSRLYVSETFTGRVWWWDIDAPGEIRGGKTFRGAGGGNLLFNVGGFVHFDGLSIEANGNVCVATFDPGGIAVVSPDGELVEHVLIDGDTFLTNICFDTTDPTVAYLTSIGKAALYRCRWARPGYVLPFTPGAAR